MEFYLIVGLFIFLMSGTAKKPTAKSAYEILKYDSLAQKYGSYYGIDSRLILAIIATESGGNELAKGPTGDFGLMQITQIALTDFNQTYGTNYSINNLFTPDINVHVGSGFLKMMIDRSKAKGLQGTDALYNAIRAYNVGLSRAGEMGFEYQKKVLAWFEIFSTLNYVS